jgi:DNA-binding NarL/FixJ family response regulator
MLGPTLALNWHGARNMQISSPAIQPHVYIQSKHPFLLLMIGKLLNDDASLYYNGVVSTMVVRTDVSKRRILLLDSCSIEHWRESAYRWNDSGGKTILLVPPQSGNTAAELRFLYLGVHGVLPLSADLDGKISQAIHSVAQGRVWMTNGAVGEFVKRAVCLSSPFSLENLTTREHQVAKLIVSGLANKEIADILAIAERTVKFHVSNILQKCNVENRRDLLVRLCNTADSQKGPAACGER